MESLLVNLTGKIAGELPWARTVDEDYGQLEALDDENVDMYPLTFPAVLIDLPGTEWSDAGDLSQRSAACAKCVCGSLSTATTTRMPAAKQQKELCSARKKEKPCTHCCRVIG